MRKEFKETLRKEMKENPNIWIISADLGYKFLDDIFVDFPERCIKTRATEQLALGLSIGLNYNNPNIIPIVYSITPFLISQPHSWIRNFLNNENCPVKLLAAGRDNDYSHDGFSHYCGDDKDILNTFNNIKCFWPKNINELNIIYKDWLYNKSPSYLNLKR